MNLNQTSAAELGSSLGISEANGTAIASHREKYGDFKTLADVTQVPGIDTKKIEKNKDRIRL